MDLVIGFAAGVGLTWWIMSATRGHQPSPDKNGQRAQPEPQPESPADLSEDPLFDDDPVPGNQEVTTEADADEQAMRAAELREEAMVAERAAAQEAAAAPAAAPAATPTVTTEVAVAGAPPFRLTCQTTGQVVEAEIHTDDAGRVINIVPIVPLEPGNEYHLGPQA